MSLPGAQLEELGAHGSLEDQEVEIDHGRGAGRVMQRVARLASTSAGREGACAGAGFGIGIAGSGLGNWGALDDGVEVVGHGLRAAADSGLGLGSGARGRRREFVGVGRFVYEVDEMQDKMEALSLAGRVAW